MLARFVFGLFSNALALWLAAYVVSGFFLQPTIATYIEVTIVFTLLNLFIRPFLKLLLSPLILITLGLGIIVVNALVLFMLDWALSSITIAGLVPLIYATLIIGAVNLILHASAKHLYHKE